MTESAKTGPATAPAAAEQAADSGDSARVVDSAADAAGSSADPGRVEAKALYKQGFAHFAKGETELAIARYREAIEVDSRLPIAWNGLSLALAKQGRLDDAIAAAEELVRLEPDDPLSHTNLSRILVQKGLIPEAEDAKARAMSLQMQKRR